MLNFLNKVRLTLPVLGCVVTLCTALPAFSADQSYLMTGTVAAEPVLFNLTIDGSSVRGDYQFLESTNGAAYSFDGTIRDNAVSLYESTADSLLGNIGLIDGRLNRHEGTFKGYRAILGRNKQTRVDLHVAYVMKSLEKEGAVVATYPDISDGTVRADIQKSIRRCDGAPCTTHINVEYLSSSYLALSVKKVRWLNGSAAPLNETEALVYRKSPKASAWRPVQLSDLVSKSAGCDARLHRIIGEGLRRQGASYISKGLTSPAKSLLSANVVPMGTGLLFWFNPKTVGSYLEGTYKVFVSRDSLGACLTRDLPKPVAPTHQMRRPS